MKTSTAIGVATATLAVTAIVAAAGAALFIWSGLYDISSTRQHTQLVYTLLERVGERSIRLRARGIDEPPLGDPALADRGALCYRDKCLDCHGGPGVAQGDIGRSMQPLPGPLVASAETYRARELYWVVRHGIKMSGMPAWQHRLSQADHWAVVAFLQQLPRLTPAQFRAATLDRRGVACESSPDDDPNPSLAADAERGQAALTQYACNACHLIPGVTGARTHVGPPLAGFARRELIAGQLPNTQANRVRWLRDPLAVDPATAMPDLDVGERDARDIAAYLGTLY